jgi:hypothetical protein
MVSASPTTPEVGLMPPPEGVIPNFYHKTDLQRTVIVVYCVTFAIASLALTMRLYTRAFIVKNAGLDEREWRAVIISRILLLHQFRT